MGYYSLFLFYTFILHITDKKIEVEGIKLGHVPAPLIIVLFFCAGAVREGLEIGYPNSFTDHLVKAGRRGTCSAPLLHLSQVPWTPRWQGLHKL